MKVMLRIILSVLLASMPSACGKSDYPKEVVRYEPTWAAAYEYPVDGSEYRGVALMLVQGRTDDELNLSSPGVAALLVLYAPVDDTRLLPPGTYNLAADDAEPLMMLGFRDDSGNITGSFVAERLPERSVVKLYALRQGRVSVAAEGEEFHIRAELEADGRYFDLDYHGAVQDLGGVYAALH